MIFSIDIVFLDKAGEVLAVHEAVGPGNKVVGPPSTRDTLELRAYSARHFLPSGTF